MRWFKGGYYGAPPFLRKSGTLNFLTKSEIWEKFVKAAVEKSKCQISNVN